MTIRNLDKAFHPQSVAVVGASEPRRFGRPGGVAQRRLRRIRGDDLAGQSEISPARNHALLRRRCRTSEFARPGGHRHAGGNCAGHCRSARRHGLSRRCCAHCRDYVGERAAPEIARRCRAAPVSCVRAQCRRPDPAARGLERQFRPSWRRTRQPRTAVAVGRAGHHRHRLGRRQAHRLFGHCLARRHGRCRCRRLPRHARQRSRYPRNSDVSGDHPQPAQIPVSRPCRGPHETGDRDQVRPPRIGSPRRGDPHRRARRHGCRRRCGADARRHPARRIA